ncbi:MAG: class I tRNA ligase family protein [Myxococcales bacterium]|nr:class I tRNA ligase family protein [Myxococcales bacterium]
MTAPGAAPGAAHRPRYEPGALEPVWRARWAKARLFTVEDPTPAERPRKSYVLAMPPYPSGRIHLGHVRAYAIGDVLARFHRMRGRHVLHPMGWDAFGLPAELAAEERGRSPREWIRDNVATMRQQLAQLGFGYDPTREVLTCEPRHYHFGQLVFTRMLRAGLAFTARRRGSTGRSSSAP